MKKKIAPRVDRTEVQRRVSTVYQMMVQGVRTSEIVRIGSEKWGIQRRAIEKYIAHAKKEIMEVCKQDRQEILNDTIASIKNIKRLSTNAGDHRTALSCDREIAELTGLKTKDVNVNLNGVIKTEKLTPEELASFTAAMSELKSYE